jgi:hypothetical protein
MTNSPADRSKLWEGRTNITPSPVNAVQVIYMTTNKHINRNKTGSNSAVGSCSTSSSSGGISLLTSSSSGSTKMSSA